MLLKIHHESKYTYDEPVPYALQRIRLTPQSSSSQKVHEWKVDYHGAAREVLFRDGFGNITELVRSERNAHDVTITVGGTVETFDNAGVEGEDYGPTPLWTWLRQTPLTTPGPQMLKLSQTFDINSPRLELLHALLDQVHASIRFVVGATDVTTNAEVALNAAEGVCQDHSHVFIGVCRQLGIPARYVSGYLAIDGTTDQAASHAWADAFVEGIGWVGFDAANGVSPDGRYVRLATGLDYRDAAPVSGIRHGFGSESLAVSINVEQ
jgi:transglutaminase-like putative cysteine protease